MQRVWTRKSSRGGHPLGMRGGHEQTGQRRGRTALPGKRSAWAVLTFLGRDGFEDVAASIMWTRQAVMSDLRDIDGLEIRG